MNKGVNEDPMLLKTRLDANELSLNVTKTKSLLIGNRHKEKLLNSQIALSYPWLLEVS